MDLKVISSVLMTKYNSKYQLSIVPFIEWSNNFHRVNNRIEDFPDFMKIKKSDLKYE